MPNHRKKQNVVPKYTKVYQPIIIMAFKIPDTITKQEADLIINKARTKKHALAYAFGFYNCLRVSEVVKLIKEDVNPDTKLMHIRQAKGSKDRKIPVAPEVTSKLRHLPINITPRALQLAVKKIGKEVLGKDIHFHTLRHSGATYYHAVKGWDIRMLQQFLGHSRLDTTQIYTHINPTDLIKRMYGAADHGGVP